LKTPTYYYLLKEILKEIWKAKLFIKIDIIAGFNKVEIVIGYK